MVSLTKNESYRKKYCVNLKRGEMETPIHSFLVAITGSNLGPCVPLSVFYVDLLGNLAKMQTIVCSSSAVNLQYLVVNFVKCRLVTKVGWLYSGN